MVTNEARSVQFLLHPLPHVRKVNTENDSWVLNRRLLAKDAAEKDVSSLYRNCLGHISVWRGRKPRIERKNLLCLCQQRVSIGLLFCAQPSLNALLPFNLYIGV